MLKGFFVLFGFLAAGEAISLIPLVKLPGSVIGMLLFTFSLKRGWVKVETVKEVCDVLLKNVAMFFVPPGVGVMMYWDLIAREWLPILVSYVLSTIIVLLTVGHICQYMEKK